MGIVLAKRTGIILPVTPLCQRCELAVYRPHLRSTVGEELAPEPLHRESLALQAAIDAYSEGTRTLKNWATSRLNLNDSWSATFFLSERRSSGCDRVRQRPLESTQVYR